MRLRAVGGRLLKEGGTFLAPFWPVFHSGAIVGGALPTATLHHPVLLPVWWALALGSCLGGNGSVIGASANVVILGIAERSGHKVSFLRFMAYGMPIMLFTLVISTLYLMLRYYL